jgi:hypothetical protein
MYLYCRCGYAFCVTIAWDGETDYMVLWDGAPGKDGPPLIECPRCGRGLALRDLQPQPSSTWRLTPKLRLEHERAG